MPSPVDKPPTMRQQQAEASRRKIVETALQLFAQQGFDGTSTRQIAAEAGIAEGSIFYYFPTKADLLTAVLETHHSFIAELRALLTAAQDEPVADLLPRLAAAWLQTLRRETAITLVLFGTAQTHPKVGRALHNLIQEGIGRLSAYLAARIQAGELRADLPVESSAFIFFSALMIFFTTHHTLSDQEWAQRAAIFAQEMVAVWLHGALA